MPVFDVWDVMITAETHAILVLEYLSEASGAVDTY